MSNDQPRRLGAYNRGRTHRQRQKSGNYDSRSYRPRDERTELEKRVDQILRRSK